MDYGNGSYPYTTWSYDTPTGRLLELKMVGRIPYFPCVTELPWFTYTYDNVGNVTTIIDQWNSSESWNDIQYDHRNRLVQATRGNATFTFAYDALGNLTQKGGLTYAYDPNRPHALLYRKRNGVVEDSFTYDANGSLALRAGQA